MTHQIDLMPATSRRRLGQRSQTRRWVALFGATVAALALTFTSLRLMCKGREAVAARLEAQVALDANQKKQAEELRGQIAQMRGVLDRHDRLALPVKASDVVAAIGQLMPETVSLTSLAVSPRQERSMARGRGSAGAAEAQAKRLVVELRGVSPDDLEMAAFVAGLEAHPLFERIAVDHARKTTVRGVEAREFGLTCEVDATARYVIGDAGSAPAPAPGEESSR